MSEWTKFCEALGYDPGCPDNYDRLLADLASGTARQRLSRDDEVDEPSDADEILRNQLRFETHGDAATWSARNGGRSFVRSIHGPHYVPKDGGDAPRTRGGFGQRGVTVWPLKPYPADNPAAASWIAGSCPANAAEVALAAIDGESDGRTFDPRLRKMARGIYHAGCRLGRNGSLTASRCARGCRAGDTNCSRSWCRPRTGSPATSSIAAARTRSRRARPWIWRSGELCMTL